MTVGELKEQLKGFKDDQKILIWTPNCIMPVAADSATQWVVNKVDYVVIYKKQ